MASSESVDHPFPESITIIEAQVPVLGDHGAQEIALRGLIFGCESGFSRRLKSVPASNLPLRCRQIVHVAEQQVQLFAVTCKRLLACTQASPRTSANKSALALRANPCFGVDSCGCERSPSLTPPADGSCSRVQRFAVSFYG